MYADDAVGLAGAHSDQPAVFDKGDGVGLDVLDRFPGKGEVGQFAGGGGAGGGGGPGLRVCGDCVGGLRQDAAAQRTQVVIGGAGGDGGRRDFQDAQVSLALQDCEGVGVIVGGDDYLVKDRRHSGGGGGGNGAVEADDAAESGYRVAFIGQLVGLGNIIPGGEAAGVGVLDDAHGRGGVVADGAPSGVGVHQVVEGQFPAVPLSGAGDAAGAAGGGDIQGALLVGIFAVAQAGSAGEADGQLAGHCVRGGGVGGQIGGDGGVIDGDVLEGFGRQTAALGQGQAGAGQCVGDPGVIGRVNYYGHRRKVFGGRPEHCGAADVNVFQSVVQGCAGLADGCRKGVEVDRHQVDGSDAVVRQFVLVGRGIAPGEQAAVDGGMQGLDAAFQNLGEAGDIGYLPHGDAGGGEGAVGAAGADERAAGVGQPTTQIRNSGLVKYAQ